MAKTEETFETLMDIYPYVKFFNDVFDLAQGFGRTPPIEYLAKRIEQELQKINDALLRIQNELNELNRRVAQGENNARRARLSDYTREIKNLALRLSNQPSDVNERRALAAAAGELANVFIEDFDLWLWTDLRTLTEYDDYGNFRSKVERAMEPDFKVFPALPVYVLSLMTWLTAIDLETGGNYELVQKLYSGTLLRHIEKLSTRPDWNEFNQPPETFPEHIKARITCSPIAQHQYARNRECTFAIVCDNKMERRKHHLRDVVITMPPGQNVLCTADPNMAVMDEREIEEEQGVKTLMEWEDILRRVESTGSPRQRQEYIGRFDFTPSYNVAFVYAVTAGGDVLWFKQRPSTEPGALAGWDGPKIVATGWNSFTSIIPAGGNRFYALLSDGTLRWYQHAGFNDGTDEWKGPVNVGSGWNTFTHVFGGSDGVIYALNAQGKMLWYRHDGFQDGAAGSDSWRGAIELDYDWSKFSRMFSAGQGVIYAMADDGKLFWYRHTGFEDGARTFIGGHEVGWGWQNFSTIFSVGEGIIYAVQPNGTLLWYKHDAWLASTPPETFRLAPEWRETLPAGSDWIGYRHIFPLLPQTLLGCIIR